MLSGISNDPIPQRPRDFTVYNEFQIVVEGLKKHLIEHKKITEEFSSVPSKPLNKLGEELLELKQSVLSLSSGLQKHDVQASQLNEDILKLEKQINLVQRTPESSYGANSEVFVLSDYFKTCLNNFESRVNVYKQEIEAIEGYLSSQTQVPLNPKELADLLRRIDEQFTSLAAYLYSANQEAMSLKSRFLRDSLSTTCQNTYGVLSGLDNRVTLSSLAALENKLAKPLVASKIPYGPSPFTSMTTIVSTLSPARTKTNSMFTLPQAGHNLSNLMSPYDHKTSTMNFLSPQPTSASCFTSGFSSLPAATTLPFSLTQSTAPQFSSNLFNRPN